MAVQSNNLLGATYRKINEGATRTYSFTLEDAAGDPIALADISAFTMALYDLTSGAIINSREAVDVMTDADFTVHATSGLVTWLIQAADMTLTQTNRRAGVTRVYRAEFIITTTGGDVLVYHEDFEILAFKAVA